MRLRPLAYMLVAGLVESGLGAVQVLPSLELSQQSIRGGGMAYGEAISFSLPPATALYTLLPAYPETLFSEYVGYVGVIPLVLAGVAALTWARRPITLLMLTLAAVGFSLALGGYNPLYPLLYHWIPGFDFFRVPARWLLVYTFGISGLAGLGAQSALDLARRTDFQLPVPPTAVRRASLLRIGVTALIVAVGIGSAGLLFLMAKPKPGVRDLEVWATLAAMTLGLIGVGSFRRLVGTIALTVIAVVGAAELWVAGGDAPYRHPIPYEAYHPDRTSTAEILAGTGGDASPGRVLSFATDKYEVKETPDYRQQYAWLDHESLFRFLVCMKLSEVLAANIPMEYGLETVDGYDGGILPLRRYAELKALLLPDPGIPADNQLRLNLVYAPQQRFLDLLNVRYILGAKLPDTFIDNVYYDRGISIVLEPGQVERLQRLPDVQTTSIGLLSNTAGAREWENADVAGTLRVTDVSGATYQFPLRIGIETGETPIEDSVSPPPNHRKPRVVPAWDGWDYADANYFVKLSLPTRMRVKELALSSQLSEADLRIRSVTLIDDVGATSASVVLSDRLDRTLFFDTKLYRVRDPFPRAFMVHSSDVREDDAALAALRDPFFTPGKTALLAPSPTARSVLPPAGADVAADRVNFSSYQPEESVLSVSARQDGYLVLLDPFYPGWTAYVDGVRVPVERADFLFRGVYLAAGQHDVVFRYEPQSFQKGLEISLASLALVVIALMAMAVAHRRSASVL